MDTDRSTLTRTKDSRSNQVVTTTITTRFTRDDVANILFDALRPHERLPGSPFLRIESFDGAYVLTQTLAKSSQIGGQE